jgi:hypothetical protein
VEPVSLLAELMPQKGALTPVGGEMLEAILGIVLEVVLVGVFYWPGWLVLRLVTAGRYPLPNGGQHDRVFVAAIGLASVATWVAIVFA